MLERQTSVPDNKAQDAGNATHTKASSSENTNVPVIVGPVKVNKDLWDYAYIAASLLIALATLVIAGIAWKQANAAKDTVDAAIRGDRAWIVISKATPPPLASQPVSGQLMSLLFGLVFKNRGKTVAQITNIQIRFHTVAKISDLPSIPDYTKAAFGADLFFGRPLPPGDIIKTTQRLEGGSLTEEQVTKIRQGELIWLIYGCISYLDFAKNPRKSQFCSVFVVPRGLVMLGINDRERFETGGPKGYNEYT